MWEHTRMNRNTPGDTRVNGNTPGAMWEHTRMNGNTQARMGKGENIFYGRDFVCNLCCMFYFPASIYNVAIISIAVVLTVNIYAIETYTLLFALS